MSAKKTEGAGITISLRFLGKRDDDLIKWWAELEPGTGSEEIKTAIRNYRGQAVSDQAVQLEVLQQTVDRLLDQVQALSHQISQGIAAAPAKPTNGELSQQEIDQRAAMLRKAGW